MTDTRRRKIKELFFQAADLPQSDRPAFLNQACKDDPDLRREVESLLKHDDDRPDAFADPELEKVRAVVSGAMTPAPSGPHDQTDPSSPIPDRLSRYRIIRTIGAGGMGVVYEAQQDKPKRRVALKVIQSAAITPATLRRFEFESDVLARLHHPGIAQIFDAGTAELVTAGQVINPRQPFIAMQLIDGTPLTEFAAARNLTIEQSIHLIIAVCDAVQHAHQQGVIHRDLKPANILVDETGAPRILDFGIARSIDADRNTLTLQTSPGQIVGTLGYMSPEQRSGDPANIDTRADVYALGVLLYEVLARRLPHDVKNQSFATAVRLIQETEPEPLSRLDARFRGDLETIAAKALEKDRDRRYASASELAADLQRYLDDQPIVARPPSSFYQLRKFARRNRPLVTAAAAIALVLIAGIIVSASQAARARRAEAATRRQLEQTNTALAQAAAVNRFLDEMLTQADPAQTQGETLTIRDVLDAAATRINEANDQPPVVQAAIHRTIGKTYQMIGSYELAADHLAGALVIRRRHLGPTDPATLESARDLARLNFLDGNLDEADRLIGETLPHLRAAQNTQPELLALALETKGRILKRSGKLDQATDAFRESLDLFQAHVRRDGPTARVMGALGTTLMRKADYKQAEPLLNTAIDLAARANGPDSPYVAGLLANRAILLKRTGRIQNAQEDYEHALAIQRKTHGLDHPLTVTNLMNYATLLNDLKHHQQALPLADECIAAADKAFGPKSFQRAMSLSIKASALAGLDRLDDALPLAEQTLGAFRAKFGPDHPYVGTALSNLADLQSKLGRLTAAADTYQQSLVVYQKTLGPNHPFTALALENLGEIAAKQNHPDTARQYLDRSLDIVTQATGPDSADVAACLKTYADIERAFKNWPKAESLYRRLLDIQSAEPIASPQATVITAVHLADCLTNQNRPQDARDVMTDLHARLCDHPSVASDACAPLTEAIAAATPKPN